LLAVSLVINTQATTALGATSSVSRIRSNIGSGNTAVCQILSHVCQRTALHLHFKNTPSPAPQSSREKLEMRAKSTQIVITF